MPTIFLMVAVTANTVVGQLVLKHAIAQLGGSAAMANLPAFALSAARSPLIYLSLGIQAFGYLLWMVLIARVKVGVATAAVGGGFYVCMALSAWALYGETLSYLQWAGIVCITVGVACIGIASV